MKKFYSSVVALGCICVTSCVGTDYADRIAREEAEGQAELDAVSENPFVIQKKYAVSALQDVLDAMSSDASAGSEIYSKKINREGVIVGSLSAPQNDADTLDITRLIYGIPFTDGGYAIVPADFRINVPVLYISTTGNISQEMVDEGVARLDECDEDVQSDVAAWTARLAYGMVKEIGREAKDSLLKNWSEDSDVFVHNSPIVSHEASSNDGNADSFALHYANGKVVEMVGTANGWYLSTK